MKKLTDYVKTAAAAEILGVSQNTLRKWAASGAIPMHRNPLNFWTRHQNSPATGQRGGVVARAGLPKLPAASVMPAGRRT